MIHSEPQANGTANRRVDSAHGQHFENESISQPADHELNGGAAASLVRQTELVPEHERRYRMENYNAECGAKDRVGG